MAKMNGRPYRLLSRSDTSDCFRPRMRAGMIGMFFLLWNASSVYSLAQTPSTGSPAQTASPTRDDTAKSPEGRSADPERRSADSDRGAAEDTDEAEVLPEVAAAIVEQTNQFRQRNDHEPLSTNESLTKAAEGFAKFMAASDKYGHRADGRTPAERARASGYQYCVVRENIAFRQGTVLKEPSELTETFVQGWIDSAEHRENMLADYITQTGVAVATVDQSTFYAVQMFGRPRSLQFQVRLVNQTEAMQEVTLEHEGNADSFELPPRVRLKVKRCLPTEFSLGDGDDAIALEQSAELAIVMNEENEAELQRVEKSTDE